MLSTGSRLTLPLMSTIRFALLVLFVTTTTAGAQDSNLRTWKDAQGKTIEASFISATDGTAVLALKSGRSLSVQLENLSGEDQKWIEEHETPAGGYAGPRAETDWPRSVSLKGLPNVKTVREDATKKVNVYESDHYEFICDSPLSINLVREFSRVFETTWLANCLLPLDLKPTPEDGRIKFRAEIFTNKDDYFNAGGAPGSAGVYMRGDKALKLPLASLGVKMFGKKVVVDYRAEDYATLVHEITHQMMNHWLWKLPTWYIEGSAEYVELAEYENGRLNFVQQDRRLKQHLYNRSGGSFSMVPPEKLMTIGGGEWSAALTTGGSMRNYASALVLTYFFYHIDGDGKGTHMKDYLHALENADSRDAAQKALDEHLMRERSFEELQREVQKGMRKEGIPIDFGE